jgi:hypothetical protein
MTRRSLFRLRLGLITTALVATAVTTGAATPASSQVQALPTPFAFVSNLDLECFKTEAVTPPPTTLVLTHLNPVLANLPRETVTLGPRVQLCVPVAKNNKIPPADVLAFIRFVDVSCYQISGPAVNFPLVLSHLNPLLSTLPQRNITMVNPELLCVPVIKNGLAPPAEVMRLVQFIDLKCYRTTPNNSLGIGLNLTQLDPVLGNIPPANVSVLANRRLCVPVQKNNQVIPPDVLNIVRWIDVELFDISAPALPTPIPLTLTHINPLLTGLPAEHATLLNAVQLGLPMAKNGMVPPSGVVTP